MCLHHEREAKGCTTRLSNTKISRDDLNEIDFLKIRKVIDQRPVKSSHSIPFSVKSVSG